jgi:phage baseplate assembly protein W
MAQQLIKKLYSDIDFAFNRAPGRNDIILSYDEMAVIRAVRYLLLTKNYERPFQPNIGSRLEQLLFEPISFVTATAIRTEIETTLTNHEPRVDLKTITVTEQPDQNAYSVSIEFYIGNNSQPTAINLILERTR